MLRYTVLCLFILLSSISSAQIAEKDWLDHEVDLKLENAGVHLERSSSFAEGALACSLIGAGVSAFGVVQGSTPATLAGVGISALALPFTIVSISQLGKAGKSLRKKVEDTSISKDELDDLRRKNKEYMKQQKQE